MGLLSRLAGISAKKEKLIRRLLKVRLAANPAGASMGEGPKLADSLPVMKLIGVPEASIVTCVETWLQFKRQGRSEREAAAAIAKYRRVPFRDDGVAGVITDIVNREHGHAQGMTLEHRDSCIREARREYSV